MSEVAVHRIIVASVDVMGRVLVDGEEATHAVRVKRVEVGEPVELLDGRGGVASGRVTAVSGTKGKVGPSLEVEVQGVRRAERVLPRVEVWSAAPKGGRVDEMVEMLSQVGAASWTPMRTARGVVHPREAKLERLGRIAAESMKQCGRAWAMEVGGERGFEEGLKKEDGVEVVLADASGGVYERTGAERVRVLVGPEGGWTEDELAMARGSGGVKVAGFGPHAMRIETAAVVAAAVVLERRG